MKQPVFVPKEIDNIASPLYKNIDLKKLADGLMSNELSPFVENITSLSEEKDKEKNLEELKRIVVLELSKMDNQEFLEILANGLSERVLRKIMSGD